LCARYINNWRHQFFS